MSTSDQTHTGNSAESELPLVGICIPVHNHKQYINECIESVAEQDYPNKMVCLIDDVSEDGSYEYIKSLFTSRHTKDVPDHIVAGMIGDLPACLLKNDTDIHGPSPTRNIGLNILMNSCPIIGFLDSDDKYLAGKISRSVNEIIRYPEVIGLVYSDGITYDERDDSYIHEYRQPYCRKRLEINNIITTPIVTRAALQIVGGFDTTLRTCEDWDMWLRITESYLAVHIADPLYMIRIQANSATFVVNEEQWKQDRIRVATNIQTRQNE